MSKSVDPPAGETPAERRTAAFGIVSDSLESGDHLDGDSTSVTPRRRRTDPGPEANIIQIAHPKGLGLGTRYRFRPGSTVVLGRSKDVDVSLPEITAISRKHASLTYRIESVTLEDLGSTNGTFVNDVRIEQPAVLKSGDRFQIGAVHFTRPPTARSTRPNAAAATGSRRSSGRQSGP